jgi:ABC-2 type transport system permease protein
MIVSNKATLLSMRLTPRQKYISLTLTAIQRAVAYRGTVVLNLLSGLVWVILVYYLWKTVFSSRGTLQGLSWYEMRTYIVLAYAVNALLSFQSLQRMMNTIRTGEVATELLRPMDFLGAQLAQAIGSACIEGLLSSCIALLISFLFLNIAPPSTPLALGLFVLSLCFGFLIKFLLGYFVALLCFYTLNAVGLIWAQTAVVNLFSGALIPLSFFPNWLLRIILITPFQGIVYTPVALYLGKMQGVDAWRALGIQLVWVVILWLLARLFWRISIRRLDIQGG